MKLFPLVCLFILHGGKTAETSCKESFVSFGEFCFRRSEEVKNFTEAKKFCVDSQSSLIKLRRQRRNQGFLKTLIGRNERELWISKSKHSDSCLAAVEMQEPRIRFKLLNCSLELEAVCEYSKKCSGSECPRKNLRRNVGSGVLHHIDLNSLFSSLDNDHNTTLKRGRIDLDALHDHLFNYGKKYLPATTRSSAVIQKVSKNVFSVTPHFVNTSPPMSSDITSPEVTTLISSSSVPDTTVASTTEVDVEPCSEGDYQFLDSCYNINFNESMTWKAANERCRKSNGGHLVVINNRFEYEALLDQINNNLNDSSQSFWVGFSVDVSFLKEVSANHLINAGSIPVEPIMKAHWVNGQPITFPNWWKIRLDTSKGSCGFGQIMLHLSDLWPLTDCEREIPFVCEYQVNAKPMLDNQKCYYEGWKYYEGSCYKYYDDPARTWSAAEETCIALGGHLTSIHSEQEQSFIRKNVRGSINEHGDYLRFWVGQFLDQNKKVVWTEGGNSSYLQMEDKTKKRMNSFQYCGSANAYTFSICNHTCDAYLPYICERKPEPLREKLAVPEEAPDEQCFDDKSWLRFGDNCYKVMVGEKVAVNYHTARTSCLKEGATLATIETYDENVFIGSKIWSRSNHPLWIGGMLNKQKDKFHWNGQEDKEVQYSNWYFGEPNNALNMESCMAIYPKLSATWNDAHCSSSHGYICEKPAKGSISISSFDSKKLTGSCPKDWYKIAVKCVIMISYIKVDISDAKNECLNLHEFATLVSIHSALEQAFLNTLLATHKQPVWIGLRISEVKIFGEYLWFDQSPSGNFSNWALHEPSSSRYEEKDCVIMSAGGQFGKWYAKPCLDPSTYGFICQMPLVISEDSPPKESPDLPVNTTCAAPFESFYAFEGDCYTLVSSPKTWQEAESMCQGMNANLVSILSHKESSFVWSHYSNLKKDDIWIGLYQKQSLGSKTNSLWSDHWPEIFSNWDEEASSDITSPCVAMSLHDGFWRRAPCEEKKSFVCKHTKFNYFPPVDHQHPGQCNQKWWDFGTEYCYFIEISSELKNWATSKDICQMLGAQMLSIHSEEEMRLMKKIAETSSGNIWLGLKRDTKGAFKWNDKSPFNYAYWLYNEPNDAQEECVEMQSGTGLWNDKRCSWLSRTMCKKMKDAPSDLPENLEQSEEIPINGRSLRAGSIVGINLGVILLLGLAGGASFIFYKWRKQQTRPLYGFDNVTYNSTPVAPKNVVLGDNTLENPNMEIKCIMDDEDDD